MKAGEEMSKNTYVLVLVSIFALIILAYIFIPREGTITLPRFLDVVSKEDKFSVIQDMRGVPPDTPDIKTAVIQCGVDLSGTLGRLGKNVTNYAFENDVCTSGAKLRITSIGECDAEISAEGRYPIYVRYDPKENKTLLYRDKVIFSGDKDFLNKCALVGILSSISKESP